MKFCFIGTHVNITLSNVAKITLPKEVRALIKIGQRNIRTNMLLFQGDTILCGAIGGIAGELAGMQLSAETCPPDEGENQQIFHDRPRGDQSREEDLPS